MPPRRTTPDRTPVPPRAFQIGDRVRIPGQGSGLIIDIDDLRPGAFLVAIDDPPERARLCSATPDRMRLISRRQ